MTWILGIVAKMGIVLQNQATQEFVAEHLSLMNRPRFAGSKSSFMTKERLSETSLPGECVWLIRRCD
jgi:hypothetical protein